MQDCDLAGANRFGPTRETEVNFSSGAQDGGKEFDVWIEPGAQGPPRGLTTLNDLARRAC